MPQRTIKNTKKGNISFLAGGNYDSLYSSILKVVGKDAPFAPMSLTTTSVTWMSIGNDSYKSIDEAPDDIKGALCLMWEQLKKELSPRLKAQKMDYVLEIPDLTYIYYTETELSGDSSINNRYKLLITGWACKYSNNQDADGDLGLKKHMYEASGKHQNVVVKVLNADNTPLADAGFLYKYDTLVSKDITSNSAGIINQGLCVVGSTLSYTYNLTGQTRTLTVQKNIEEYTLVFAPIVKVTVKVIDQHDRPLQSQNVTLEYGAKKYNVQTDGLGVFVIDDLLYNDPNMQAIIDVHGFGSECFPVTYPETTLTMRVNVPEKINPLVLVMRDGKPECNYSLRFSGAVVGVYNSDAEGKIYLDTLQEGEQFYVESLNEDCRQEYSIVKDQTVYEFHLPHVEQHPLPFPCYLKVVRGELQLPVQNHFVDIKGEVVNAGQFTDALGVIPLGSLCPGEVLHATPDGLQEPCTIVIEEGKSEYLIVLPETFKVVSCHLKVVSGEDMKPVPGYRLGIHSDSVNGMFTTDLDGIIPLVNMKVGENVDVYLTDPEATESFTIIENKEEYIIYLKKPDLLQSAYIKVVRGGELEPIPDYTLKIDSETMQGFYKTDAYGIVPLGEQKPGTRFLCATDLDNPPMEFEIVEGQEEYLIKIEDKGKVTKGDIVVTLVDKDKVTPVHPATFTLTNRNKETFTSDNDPSGSIVVPRSFFTHNEKVRMDTVAPNYKIRPTKFKYTEEQDHYIIHLTDPFKWKLLLWLLLPILLFLLCLINCTRDISVHAEDQDGNVMSGTTVNLDYTEHALYKNGEFFYSRDHHLTGVTDSNGDYTFEDVPCSVYSYIFYCFNKGTVSTGPSNNPSGVQSVNSTAQVNNYGRFVNEASTPVSKQFLFHWKKKISLTVPAEKAPVPLPPTPPVPDPEPEPEVVDMLFRTIDATTLELLPDCTLKIKTSKSGVTTPTNSGNGKFLVQGLYSDETITIVASKQGYGVNDVKVRDALVYDLLSADQDKRDIPLTKLLSPCNAGASGASNVDAYTVSTPISYNMGKTSGTFSITYSTGSQYADCIDLYNHNPGEAYSTGVKVFSSGMVATNGDLTKRVSFSNGSVITVIVTTGNQSGSVWNYTLSCPN